MLRRRIAGDIEKWIDEDPDHALLITGSRQVGKTYIIREVLRNRDIPFIEFNFIKQPELTDVFKNVADMNDLWNRLSVAANRELQPGKMFFFLDEVQECKDIVTWIKFLVEDGRLRFILSGSLLGIELSDLRSAPVGYLKTLDMYPMDLFEFYLALGLTDRTIKEVKKAYNRKTPLDDFIHQKLLRAFHLYLIVGGMPEAVQTYVDSSDLSKVAGIHKDIIRQYKVDFTKYEEKSKLILREVYDAIPGELEEKNKRFFINHLDGAKAYERHKESFLWLKDAGVALPVYNVTEPKAPLIINEKRNLFKLFLSDVGLLCSFYSNDVKMKIIQGNGNINNGGLYENAIAQELFSKGIKPYYFNSKKQGELDFVIEFHGRVMPIEVKSGKEYQRHSALTNCLNDVNYQIEEAVVLCNQNLSIKEKVVYMPVYMISCMDDYEAEDMIYHFDLKDL